jgi:LCP family protein required for cell wall assembly
MLPADLDPPPTEATSSGPAAAGLDRRGWVRASLGRRIAAGLAALVALVSATGFTVLHYADGQIARIDVFGGLRDRPARTTDKARNYLVVGSDTREGLTPAQRKRLHVGSTATAAGRRSDTLLLVHIPRDREQVVVVSLPRDSYVTIPEHAAEEGGFVPAAKNKLNAAYGFGGPALTVATVEQATSVRIDHYVEVDFAGFARIVDELGGVDLCVPRAIEDDKSHLSLPAGSAHLDGVESLKYVRTRAFDGRGDLGRIERQQEFLGAVVREATSSSTLLNPARLAGFVNASLDAVRTDPDLDRGRMLELARRLRGLSPDRVTFVTAPIANPDHRPGRVGSTVLWDENRAADLFGRIRDDRPLDEPADPSASGSTVAGGPTVPPTRINVRVYNASGVTGLGRRTATELAAAGFGLAGPARSASTSGEMQTRIRYDPRWDESVKTLAAALPGARLERASGLGATFEVLVGASQTAVTPVTVRTPVASASPGPAPSLPPRTASHTAC